MYILGDVCKCRQVADMERRRDVRVPVSGVSLYAPPAFKECYINDGSPTPVSLLACNINMKWAVLGARASPPAYNIIK